MQFLLELPSRLNQCMEMKTYAVAVKYYTTASKILGQYSHLPSFKSIQQESNEVIQKMKNILKRIIYQPNGAQREVEDNLRMLIQLKEPVDSLRKEFLDQRREKLKNITTNFKINQSATIRAVSTKILVQLEIYLCVNVDGCMSA